MEPVQGRVTVNVDIDSRSALAFNKACDLLSAALVAAVENTDAKPSKIVSVDVEAVKIKRFKTPDTEPPTGDGSEPRKVHGRGETETGPPRKADGTPKVKPKAKHGRKKIKSNT